MARTKTLIILGLFLFAQVSLGVMGQKINASEGEEQGLEEDLEIIEILDLLDDFDLLKEDMVFLKQYEDIDQSESIGEGDD